MAGASFLQAKPKSTPKEAPAAKAPVVSEDDAVRLQIFLDDHNFGPGKIDGSYGGFTRKSWQYYQRAQGETAPKDTFDVKSAPLATNDPIYTMYTATAADLGSIGPVPAKLEEQSKGKSMPYGSMSELLGERYHSAVKFLAHLNPGKNLDQLKEGDQVKVPNVAKPFDLAEVIAMRDGISAQGKADRDKAQAAKESAGKKQPDGSPAASAASTPAVAGGDTGATPGAPASDPSKMMIHVSVADAYLEVHDGDKVVAGFPITPGSTAIPSPKGEWKIESKTLLPNFRWDKSMLMHGTRSKDFHMIPPGPNNPVGITWIALNKSGIGLHGTNDPGNDWPRRESRLHPAGELGRVQGLRAGAQGREGGDRVEVAALVPTVRGMNEDGGLRLTYDGKLSCRYTARRYAWRMPATISDLFQQALTLPDESKLLLAEELVASVSAAVPADDTLVSRRRAEFLSGAATLIPADQALRQVREDLAAQQRA